jgi:tetratricopeptide (TPR) repeat protein
MSEDQALQYLQQGIAAAKAKQSDEARRLLQNAIRLNPASETAWLWLSSVAKDNQERIFCLKQILQLNPENEMALKGLTALGVSPEPEQAAAPKSTVPQPERQKIAAARATLEPIIREALEQPDPYENLDWMHKTRNRAGERAATLLTLTVRIVPLLILVCLLAGVAYVATNTPGGIALAPTWTPSHTPTNTATPTPGFTPTPSPTPELTYTPSPTLDPVIPVGDLFSEMTPTPVYPRISSGPLLAAVVRMDHGEYAEVLPTLSSERELTSSNFDPNPYYYEAIALTNMGDTERAERLLDEAVTRLDELRELDRIQAEPLIRAGLAYVYAAMDDYTNSNEEADRALEGDSRLHLPYQVLARNALAQNEYQTASEVISEGLRNNPGDVNLWILRGELNLQRGQPADAQQDAFVALAVDPTSEEAYLLQARADVARGDFGLAVLHLQSYLFIYPGSIQGWTLLGEARTLEGNTDLAIAAYSQALNTDEPMPVQATALRRQAELYLQRHQYSLASDDYSILLRLDEDDGVAREGRARAAFEAGRYGEAIEDLDVLLEDQPDRADLRLLKARALVDGANPRNEAAYEDALDEAYDLLTGNLSGLPQGLLTATNYEYRARILFTRERYSDALSSIEDALQQAETGSAHYWRGRILEARGEEDEAVREYEWVRLWGQTYAYPFLPDVATRLRSLSPEAES